MLSGKTPPIFFNYPSLKPAVFEMKVVKYKIGVPKRKQEHDKKKSFFSPLMFSERDDDLLCQWTNLDS